MCKYISILFSLCYVISTAEYTTTNGGSFTSTFDIQEMINFHHHRIKVIASKNPNPNQCSQPPPLGLNAIIGSLFDVGVKFISTSTSSMVLDSRFDDVFMKKKPRRTSSHPHYMEIRGIHGPIMKP